MDIRNNLRLLGPEVKPGRVISDRCGARCLHGNPQAEPRLDLVIEGHCQSVANQLMKRRPPVDLSLSS